MAKTFLASTPQDPPSMVRNLSAPLILGGILFGTLILWASAFVAIPIALESVAPVPMIMTRLLLSSIFLFPFLVKDWSKVIRPRLKKDFWQILLMAGSGIFLYLLFLTYGQRTVGAGQTSFIINLTPLVTGLFAALILKEVFHKRMIFGALLALLGVGFLVFQNGGGLTFNLDAVLVFGAMVSASLYYVIQRRLTKFYSPLTLTALTIVGGTIMFLPFFPGTFEGLAGMTARSAGGIFYLGIGTIFAYVGWAYVISRLEVGKAALYLYSIPLISTFLGWWILDEAITSNLLFSGALIFLGVMVGTGVIKVWPGSAKRKFKKARPQDKCPDAP
ncbi:MAG: DMT family transporter [Alphaproteobacteria bacterium]